jgi:cobalt-zinc-cadmium resistance protein CzcA
VTLAGADPTDPESRRVVLHRPARGRRRRDRGQLPAQDRDAEGQHRRRLLRCRLMLNAVITWSLRHRAGWSWLWLAVAIGGVAAFRGCPSTPSPTPRRCRCRSTRPRRRSRPWRSNTSITFPRGASARWPARPHEVRSVSRFGFAQVTVTFDDGTDVYRARQAVSERLRRGRAAARHRAPDAGPGLDRPGRGLPLLVGRRRLAGRAPDRPRLGRGSPSSARCRAWPRSTPGAATSAGSTCVVDPVRAPQVRARPATTSSKPSSQQPEAWAAARSTRRASPRSCVAWRSLAEYRDVEQVVVRPRGRARAGPRRGAAWSKGGSSGAAPPPPTGRARWCWAWASCSSGRTATTVTGRSDGAPGGDPRSLPPASTCGLSTSAPDLVDRVLHTVRTNLARGRAAGGRGAVRLPGHAARGLVVASAIPLSLLFAFVLMTARRRGREPDEPGRHRLRAHRRQLRDHGRELPSGACASSRHRPRLEVVREAALEVRKPTMFGELIILVVYLPILALEGIEGQLFRPMALTMVFALLGSMLLSLTLMPVLASLVLPNGHAHRAIERVADAALHRRPIDRCSGPSLRAPGHRPGGRGLLWRSTRAAWPRSWARSSCRACARAPSSINTVRLAGVSLDESVRYGGPDRAGPVGRFPDEIETHLDAQWHGRGHHGPDGHRALGRVHHLTPWIAGPRPRPRTSWSTAMQASLEGLPGMRMVFTQPIEMRMNEMIAGIRADVGVKLFGESFDVLRDKAREIDRVLAASRARATVHRADHRPAHAGGRGRPRRRSPATA